MFGLEKSTLSNTEKNQVNLSTSAYEQTDEISDPIEEAKKELCDELKSFEKKAEDVANNPKKDSIDEFASDLKGAKNNIADANIRKYGYNPPKEMVELHSKVEHFYNQMIRNEIACSMRYRETMNKLNELLGMLTAKDEISAEDKPHIEKLFKELNESNLEMPSSHPGMLSNNEKSGFKINFSSTDDIEIIKREANRFYSMCESSMHQLFIFIQKLFNDLLSIFDTAKASLRNDPITQIVRNQTPR